MISCLMVTAAVPERFDFMRSAVRAFCAQTHQDKELVVVLNQGTAESRARVAEHLAALRHPEIRIVEVDRPMSLGALRRLSVGQARGDVLCQWDDDDLYHPERLERQLARLDEGGWDAVYLADLMHYFPRRSILYCARWRATEAGGHPGTLMVRNGVPLPYPETGGTAARGEDLHVALALKEQGRVGYLEGEPHLFVYVSHGANTWDDGHHGMLAETLAVSRGLLLRREGSLREGLAPFGLAGQGIVVAGSNGPAFTL